MAQHESLRGKTAVVTGGTGGIGLHTAIGLARAGAKVLVTGRSEERGRAAVASIARASGRTDVELVLSDLSRVAEVRELARKIARVAPSLDVLVNNAGSLAGTLSHNADGVELDFAVNVVAPYLLTRELRGPLAAAAPARVINVTGGMPFGGLDLTNLQAGKGFTGLPTYSHTKRAMEAMSLALARELAPERIHVLVVYPGSAHTAMTGAMTPAMLPFPMRLLWPVFKLVMRPDGGKGAERASRSSVWAATSPELEGVTGRSFDTAGRPSTLHRTVLEEAAQRGVVAAVEAAIRSERETPTRVAVEAPA